MIGVLGRKMASFARAPLFTKLWFLPAWMLLGLGRLAVLLVPFRQIAPALGTAAGTDAQIPLLTPDQRQRALLVGRTVRMAARYALFVHEMPAVTNWTTAGTGPKYLERPLNAAKPRIGQEISKFAARLLKQGRGFSPAPGRRDEPK